MSGTYTDLIYHLVFSTKNRRPSINGSVRDELHRYLGGIILCEQGQPIQVGGISDHVHLLVRLKPVVALSDVMQRLKTSSSKWMRDHDECACWTGWQDGYAAFSVSRSQVERLRAYIANQDEHHRRRDFKFELRPLLEKHGIEFDEARIWD
jgi:putative transposase